MFVNDDAGFLDTRVALRFFASMLAPTGGDCAELQSVTVGILRGAMKYIQVSAMKYIAGIMVNSTV